MSEQSYTERSANAQLEQQREKRILKIFMAVPASILVVLALVFVPMIIADQPRRNFQKNLRKRATPAELQVWGMGVLQFFQTNRNFEYNTITNIHRAFHGLDKWKPNACF